MSDHPAEPNPSTRRTSGYAIGIPLVLLVFYVSAPMPMLALVEKVAGGSLPPAMETIITFAITPLTWLYNSFPPYAQWIDWQAGLFGIH